ncbi:MAG: hypothetical protein ACJASO_002392 [Cyclobacteriaceae bacterium]|jgi:hypothetical protein
MSAAQLPVLERLAHFGAPSETLMLSSFPNIQVEYAHPYHNTCFYHACSIEVELVIYHLD